MPLCYTDSVEIGGDRKRIEEVDGVRGILISE